MAGKRGEGDCISRLEVCVCTALSRAQDFGQEGSGLPMKSGSAAMCVLSDLAISVIKPALGVPANMLES